VARALCLAPDLLVLDEPVSALDLSVQAQIIELLQERSRDTGLALLFVSHDLALVKHLCSKVLVLDCGRLRPE
jgi:peptide/nickel transport system ATP-binding protein